MTHHETYRAVHSAITYLEDAQDESLADPRILNHDRVLKDLECAEAYVKRAMDNAVAMARDDDMTWKDIAAALGRHPSTVAQKYQ